MLVLVYQKLAIGIEDNQQQPADPFIAIPEPVQPLSKPKLNKSGGLTIVLATALILVSFIAGFFAWQNQKLVKSLREQVTKNQLTPTASQTPNGDLADWKTYSNILGYELKYPTYLVISETSPKIISCNSGFQARSLNLEL